MYNCINCNAAFKSSINYCVICGEKQNNIPITVTSFSDNTGCPKCGNPKSNFDNFCWHCGWYVKDNRCPREFIQKASHTNDHPYYWRLDLPNLPIDVIEYWEYFVFEMRHNNPVEVMERCVSAINYIDSQGQLVDLTTFSVDQVYLASIELLAFDQYTKAYFQQVVRAFWEKLKQKGIRVLYILDNSITPERLVAVHAVFQLSGFAFLTPNFKGMTIEHETLLGMIQDYLEEGENLIYVEPDASVNYLNEVINLGKKSKGYVHAIRSEAPIRGSKFTVF